MATIAKATTPAADPSVSSWVRVMCALIVAGAAPTALGDASDGNGEARRAAVATARAEVDRAQAVVTAATARIRASWKANEQYIAAEEELSAARRDLNKAMDGLRDKLKQDDAYKAALREEADAAGRVRSEQAETNAAQPASTQVTSTDDASVNVTTPSTEQMQAASQRLEHKSRLRDLEQAAIAANPEASKAQARLDLAQRQMKVFQLQLDAALKNDPEYKTGMEQLAAARSRVSEAAASHPDRTVRTRP